MAIFLRKYYIFFHTANQISLSLQIFIQGGKYLSNSSSGFNSSCLSFVFYIYKFSSYRKKTSYYFSNHNALKLTFPIPCPEIIKNISTLSCISLTSTSYNLSTLFSRPLTLFFSVLFSSPNWRF